MDQDAATAIGVWLIVMGVAAGCCIWNIMERRREAQRLVVEDFA